MYTIDADMVIEEYTIEKIVNKSKTMFIVSSIVFSISLGVLTSALVNTHKVFFGFVAGIISILMLALIYFIKY